MYKKLSLLVMASLLMQSCVSNQYLKMLKTAQNPLRLYYLEPMGYVEFAQQSRKFGYSEDLTRSFEQKIDSVIDANKERYQITGKFQIRDAQLRADVRSEIATMGVNLATSLAPNKVEIPQKLDSILDANNQRYLLIPRGFGTVRVKKNSFGKALSELAIEIVTLGIKSYPSAKSEMMLGYLLLDAKENKLVGFHSGGMMERGNPLDGKMIEQKLDQIFIGSITKK